MSKVPRCLLAKGLGLDSLSDNDRAEVAKFAQVLGVEHARRSGADPAVCNMLEAVIYPEGIGRPPIDPVDA